MPALCSGVVKEYNDPNGSHILRMWNVGLAASWCRNGNVLRYLPLSKPWTYLGGSFDLGKYLIAGNVGVAKPLNPDGADDPCLLYGSHVSIADARNRLPSLSTPPGHARVAGFPSTVDAFAEITTACAAPAAILCTRLPRNCSTRFGKARATLSPCPNCPFRLSPMCKVPLLIEEPLRNDFQQQLVRYL